MNEVIVALREAGASAVVMLDPDGMVKVIVSVSKAPPAGYERMNGDPVTLLWEALAHVRRYEKGLLFVAGAVASR